jgi:spore coat polysaccharide biosynthesis protein SpsF
VPCFRGNEHDVLDRYVSCAARYAFDHVIRLTADNPFTDMEELDRLIDLHLRDGNDYTHSFGVLPVGVGAEIFTRQALERSRVEGQAPNHREHVNEYVQEHPELFKIGSLTVSPEKNRPDLSLTVDTERDYAHACRLAAQASGTWLTTVEAIAAC